MLFIAFHDFESVATWIGMFCVMGIVFGYASRMRAWLAWKDSTASFGSDEFSAVRLGLWVGWGKKSATGPGR